MHVPASAMAMLCTFFLHAFRSILIPIHQVTPLKHAQTSITFSHSTVWLLLLAQNSRFAQPQNWAGFSWFSLAAGRVATDLPLSTFLLQNGFRNLDCKVREAFKYSSPAVHALFLFVKFFPSVRLRWSPRFKFVEELRQTVRAGVKVVDPGVQIVQLHASGWLQCAYGTLVALIWSNYLGGTANSSSL